MEKRPEPSPVEKTVGWLIGQLAVITQHLQDAAAKRTAEKAEGVGDEGSAAAPAQDPASEGSLAQLLAQATQIAQRLPGVAAAELAAVEDGLLRRLKDRLDKLETGPAPAGGEREPEAGEAPRRYAAEKPAPAVDLDSPADLLTNLLERSLEEAPEESRRGIYAWILRQLTPDEARILSALSDGTPYPLLHVGYGSMLGPITHRVLENASSVGRASGVLLQDMVPQYVAHLRDLHLVDTDEEDPRLAAKYDILQSDSAVQTAIVRIEKQRHTPRLIKRTLHITPFGRSLWEACRGIPTETSK